jgi:hypothetical protein
MKLNLLKLYLFLGIIFATITLKAQNTLFGLGGGGGTFYMNSIREFNQIIVKQLPFKPAIKDNFPPYFFSKVELLYCFPENLAIGINFSSTSTGSRYSLADYSGKYTLDNIQQGLFPGIKLLLGKAPGKSNGINFSLEGGAVFSKMTVNEKIIIYDKPTKDINEFNAQGFYVQPGICYFQNIIRRVKVCANLSYYLDFEKGYHLPNKKDQVLINSETKKPIKPQWDGIRLGITAYWSFRNNSK